MAANQGGIADKELFVLDRNITILSGAFFYGHLQDRIKKANGFVRR